MVRDLFAGFDPPAPATQVIADGALLLRGRTDGVHETVGRVRINLTFRRAL